MNAKPGPLRFIRRAAAPGDSGSFRSQRGFGLIELALAGLLTFTLLSISGYLFKNQVQNYLDIRDQANVQSGVKKALQAMVRQISNAGACLPDPMDHFSAKPEKFTFAYLDLGGSLCDPNAKAVVSFYTLPGKTQDALMQDIDCGGKLQARTLASGPKGSLSLAFRYLDKSGKVVTLAKQVKVVELDLKLQTGKAKSGSRPQKAREQIFRVQCVNL